MKTLNQNTIAQVVSEIAAIIEKNEFCIYGLRAVDFEHESYNLESGDAVAPSYDWDFENDCFSDEQMDGASTIHVTEYEDDIMLKITKYVKNYAQQWERCPSRMILVGGDNSRWGDDECEAVIDGCACAVYQFEL